MADAENIGRHQFASSERLFFDTNIWLLLFDCRSNRDISINADAKKIYSGAFKRALKAESQLFTHPFVISEFVNRLLRDEHNFLRNLNEAHNDFKTWRGTDGFRTYAAVVATRTRDILKCCRLIENNFDEPALLSRLTYFEEDARDLNDEFLIEICERNNLTLVTHDGDFAHAELKILTTNTNYFNRS